MKLRRQKPDLLRHHYGWVTQYGGWRPGRTDRTEHWEQACREADHESKKRRTAK